MISVHCVVGTGGLLAQKNSGIMQKVTLLTPVPIVYAGVRPSWLARTVIGGLVTSTLLTLLVLPVVYPWFSRSKPRK